ncbi:hypothetical protein KUTeg_006859 [Tegillarca granosa]|uniref:Uncharacterized protein n=1 Tax=Tegillarca granosa TaxID=220873 RepID=A0ABQ9FBJ6_TEGGR|nr:hypothetical protein KUTeg_006859 [Tegillarca granosa]
MVDIRAGNYSFVMALPESAWNHTGRLSIFPRHGRRIAYLDGEQFRREFQMLHKLRSVFNILFLALTATNRPNIFIDFLKSKSTNLTDKLQLVIDHIKKLWFCLKIKNIIYCRSIDKVADVFLTLKERLGMDAYADQVQDSSHLLFEMFHKSTNESSKSRIISSFKVENSNLR